MRLTFGQWTPDNPGIADSLVEAKNVLPLTVGYGPIPTAEDFSGAASENLLTAFPGRFGTTTQLFAAGATKLFKFDTSDASLDDVSRVASAYTSTELWTFTQFGAKVIAANGVDKLQSWTVGSSSKFVDLAAAAPTAQYVTTVRDFVVAGKTATYINRLYWSDINDETDWTVGAGSQADTQDIPDGGEIRGVTGGEFGVVLLERSIVRMTYIGAPYFFQFDNITRSLGCYEPRSVVQYGSMTYFLSDDGFYVTDGQTVKPIGNNRVDKYFFDTVNTSLLNQMSAAVDPINKTVAWAYTDVFSVKRMLIYNWAADKWSQALPDLDFLCSIATTGTDLDSLAAQYGDLESIPVSLDSRIWAGGKLLFGGVNDAKIVSLGGSAASAEIQTGDLNAEGAETIITLANPLIDGGSATVATASRYRLDGSISFGTAVAADSENRVSLRSRGKFHRLSIVPTGSWDTMVGIDVNLVPVGKR